VREAASTNPNPVSALSAPHGPAWVLAASLTPTLSRREREQAAAWLLNRPASFYLAAMPECPIQTALQARAAGRHDDAIAAWRAALAQAPDDWQLALQLRQSMKAALHYPDSDAAFRRAARSLPDAEWLGHYAALYAFHMDDLDALDARARRMLPDQPGPALHALLGDAARQRRDWPAAQAAFAEAHRLDPAHPDHAAKRDAAALYQRVARTLAARPDAGEKLAVAVINLDRNAERRAWIERLFPGVHRIPAVEGSRLPGAAVARLLSQPGDDGRRGTLGCFLSHAAAWDWARTQGLPHLLVIEDDVIPLLDLPRCAGPLGLPPGYDLCFVNDRLEPRIDPLGVEAPSVRPLADALQTFPPEDNAPGADGYIVSAAGAAKLLDWVGQDGFTGDADWRLLAYGMTPEAIAVLPRHAYAWTVLDRLRHGVPRAERLSAWVMHPALIRTVGVSSDREDDDRGQPVTR
jgi:tetratricopeptide (TPR) repeat protein